MLCSACKGAGSERGAGKPGQAGRYRLCRRFHHGVSLFHQARLASSRAGRHYTLQKLSQPPHHSPRPSPANAPSPTSRSRNSCSACGAPGLPQMNSRASSSRSSSPRYRAAAWARSTSFCGTAGQMRRATRWGIGVVHAKQRELRRAERGGAAADPNPAPDASHSPPLHRQAPSLLALALQPSFTEGTHHPAPTAPPHLCQLSALLRRHRVAGRRRRRGRRPRQRQLQRLQLPREVGVALAELRGPAPQN